MKLTIAENFLMLAQHPGKGRFLTSGIYINYGLIGALVLEMILHQKLEIENDRLVVKTRKQSTNPIESQIVSSLKKFNNPRSMRRSIHKLSRKTGSFKKILLRQMARKGYLRIEEKTLLGFIRYKRHYLANTRLRNALIRQLKDNLLYQKELRNEDAVLLGLVEAVKLHKVLAANKEELKTVRQQLKVKLSENAVASSVDKTIRQVQAAVMGAVVASTVAAGSSR